MSMTTLSVSLLAAACVLAPVAAQFRERNCSAPASGEDVYSGDGSACSTYRACEANLCTCLGQPGRTSALLCLNATGNATEESTGVALSCPLLSSCLDTFLHTCVREAAANDTADTSVNCATWQSSFNAALMPTLVGNTSYDGTVLQASCQYRVCLALDWTGLGDSCVLALGRNDSSVCRWAEPANDPPPENVTIGPRNPVVPPPYLSHAAPLASRGVTAAVSLAALLLALLAAL